MAHSFIITTQWWADASAVQAWPLLLQTSRWPQWWAAVASTGGPGPGPALSPALPAGPPWRLLLGRPLRLAVERQLAQPRELITLRLRGDLLGQASFMLDDSGRRGVDITCRLELSRPHGHWRLLSLLFERRLFALVQSLARDLGRALQCRVEMRGEWHGSSRRP